MWCTYTLYFLLHLDFNRSIKESLQNSLQALNLKPIPMTLCLLGYYNNHLSRNQSHLTFFTKSPRRSYMQHINNIIMNYVHKQGFFSFFLLSFTADTTKLALQAALEISRAQLCNPLMHSSQNPRVKIFSLSSTIPGPNWQYNPNNTPRFIRNLFKYFNCKFEPVSRNVNKIGSN